MITLTRDLVPNHRLKDTTLLIIYKTAKLFNRKVVIYVLINITLKLAILNGVKGNINIKTEYLMFTHNNTTDVTSGCLYRFLSPVFPALLVYAVSVLLLL